MSSIRMVLQNNTTVNELLSVFRPRICLSGTSYSDDFLNGRIKMACEIMRQNHEMLSHLVIDINKGDAGEGDSNGSCPAIEEG